MNETIMQNAVGNLLKYGVWIVLSVGIVGGLIFLSTHADATVDYRDFVENDRSIFEVLREIAVGISEMDGASIIYLAIILLFLTPFVRLILSLISFILEKDLMYVLITLIVLIIICCSVYFGYAH
ncbi:DUF1634 domain-containing protein [Sphingobacterium populi]|uniref:DUF1634 domain-containing protein n=2 Tax=Sphingobacterium TaxID=28453 RepID=A0ABW5UHC5_9SPHI